MVVKRKNKQKAAAMKVKREIIRRKKTGGFLPALIPLLGSIIGALGGLAAGSAGIATAVNKAKQSAKLLEETKRHNVVMEGKGLTFKSKKNKVGKKKFAKGKRGKGLYVKPQTG